MKVYTRKGDKGKTGLVSGERVKKSHPIIEASGDIDELNSFLGAVSSAMSDNCSGLKREIKTIQLSLINIGAWISNASNSGSQTSIIVLKESLTKNLEKSIDNMEKQIPAIKEFILPGGHMAASMAHIARTVCRRAERHVIKIFEETEMEDIPDQLKIVLSFLNRLSDYLFVLARYYNNNYN